MSSRMVASIFESNAIPDHRIGVGFEPVALHLVDPVLEFGP